MKLIGPVGAGLLIALLCSLGSAEDELDFESDIFDEFDFDAVAFEAAEELWFDDIRLELSHNLASSRLADWGLVNNATSGVIGWSGSLSSSLFVELEGQLDWYWAGDTRRAGSNKLEEQIGRQVNVAYVQGSFADASVKAGYYTIGWGEVDGGGALDVVNPSADITNGAMDARGTPQPFIGLDYYAGAITASTWVNLHAKVNEVPGFDEPDTGQEIGAKVTLRVTGSDFSLYGGRLLPNSPIINLANSESLVSPYWLIGASANRSFGKTLAKVDVAFKRGLDILTMDGFVPGNAEVNRLDYALGFEIGLDSGQQVILSISNQQILDFQPSYQAIPGFTAKEHSAMAIVSVSDSYFNEDLSLNAGGIGSIDRDMALCFVNLDYRFSDHWNATSGVMMVSASDASAYSTLNEEVQISAGLTFLK